MTIQDIRQAVFNSENTNILTISSEKEVKLLDIEEFRDVTSLSVQSSHFLTCEYSPDGKKILTLTADGVIQTWDSKSGRQLLKIKYKGELDRFIKNIGYIDVASGKQIEDKNSKYHGKLVSYTEDGSKLIEISGGKVINVWDAGTDKELLSIELKANEIGAFPCISAVLSPDGKMIITGGAGGLHIWDAESGIELFRLSGFYYRSFQLKPDSRMLIILSADKKKVVLVNLDMNWVIETAKRSLNRY